MRSLSPGMRRSVAVAALLSMFAAPAVYADEPIPTDPQARIHPPIGLTSQEARIHPPGGVASTDARIRPPGGRTASQGRISPPIGVTAPEPSWFELLTEWLHAQARIHPPTG